MQLTREEWLKKRREYLGGSDAAAAIGLSRFKTPLQVWQEKIGQAIDEPTEAMIRGQELERFVARLYQEDTGHTVTDAAWIVSKDVKFMAATPDLLDETANSLVQIKTASAWGRHLWGPDGSSQVPTDYMIQAQHEMAVIGAKRNLFAVLFADNDMFRALVWMVKAKVADGMIMEYVLEQLDNEDSRCEFGLYPIERDDELIATIIEGEERFWKECVLAHVMPPDPSIPETSSEFITADVKQRKLIEKLRDADEKLDEADAQYDQVKAAIIAEIGDHAGIVADGLAKIHYKAPSAKPKTDWQAVAKQMRPSAPERYDLLVKQHTETVQASRVFRPYWK